MQLLFRRLSNYKVLSAVKLAVFVGALMALLVTSASATVVGTLATGSGGSIMVSLTFIRFTLDPSANPAGAPWNAEVSTATNLMFAGCSSGVLGSAGCLDAPPNSPNEAISINHNTDLTATTVLPEDGFLLFAGNGTSHATIDYTLSQVLLGPANTNCAGLAQFQSCSVVAGSPIVLTLQGTGTTATLNLAGTVSDGVGPANSWTGKFSATFPNQTPADLQAFILGGGVVNTSNSGTFASTAIPEPSYAAILIGGALVSLATLLRKRKQRNEIL